MPSDDLSLRDYTVAEVNWRYQQDVLADIRRDVFILEQGIPAEEEWDGLDDDAWHWLASDREDRPVGTARLLPTGQIGRMAVQKSCRKQGVGAALLEAVMVKARHLGMTRVFLHAQTDVTGFYERLGFQVSGETFVEAGIDHRYMARELPLLDTPVGAPESELQTTVRGFDVAEVSWASHSRILSNIRLQVFVLEQNVTRDIEQDGRDEGAHHWLARDLEGNAIGTGRLLPDGQIGRMAVLREFRGQGIGFSILESAVLKARRLGFSSVYLHAQAHARAFYEKAGFIPHGEPFDEAGIPHLEMYQDIELDDPLEERGIVRRAGIVARLQGDEYLSEAGMSGQVLGHSNKMLILRKEEDFRYVSLDLAQQAQRSVRIYSPWLDHALYDNLGLQEALSRLARRNKHTLIQILVWNAHRITKHGHKLLELSRKLPSSMQIRIVHEDYRQMNHEYVLADERGIVYRLDYEVYEGYANFNDMTEVNRLGREFLRAWETSQEDPNVRQLKI